MVPIKDSFLNSASEDSEGGVGAFSLKNKIAKIATVETRSDYILEIIKSLFSFCFFFSLLT